MKSGSKLDGRVIEARGNMETVRVGSNGGGGGRKIRFGEGIGENVVYR